MTTKATSPHWNFKTVQLHKDKHMKQAKSGSAQPRQLNLFQMLVNEHFSNSVELYQTLPDVFSGKQDKLRNKDWTLPVLSHVMEFIKKHPTVLISLLQT